MGTIVILTFVSGIVAALLTGLTGLFSLKNGKSAIVGILIATFIAALAEFLLLYFGMPSFAHWSSGGYVWTIIFVLISAVIGAYIAGYDEYDSEYRGAHWLLGVSLAGLCLFGIIAIFIVPPAAFNNAVWDEIASLANVQEATQDYLEAAASDNDLLKVSPAHANLEAKGEMPGDVGSYAEIGTTFEQTVANQQVYITDLNVTNWRGFRSNGAALPGYFIRPAKDVDAPTTFVPGYSLKYVPDARWNTDLKRHVYLNYTLSCNCEVENLDVLEIDDKDNPMYTGTVWEYSIGNVGMVATKVIVVDPTTGTITEYSIEEAPDWIDRVYSLAKMRERVDWWATYSEWDAEFLVVNNSGKMKVDASEDVYGPDGKLEYMITVTSSGSDQTLKYDLRVDPKTGEVVKFPATGKTLEAVKNLIEEQTFTEAINTALGAEPIECERQNLLGQKTYYCILQSRSKDDGSSGAMVGYAFLQERFTTAANKVVVADNFSEAWNLLRLQITRGSGDVEIQGDSAEMIVVEGELLLKGDWSTGEMVWFIVKNDDYPEGLYFRVSQDNPIIALSQPGHTVEVAAFDLTVDQANDVLTLVNKSLPALTPIP